MQGKQKKSVFLFPQKRLQRIVLKKGVHAENLVIDKHARLIRGKRIIASPDKPGYIKRGDRL